MTNINRRK